MFLDTDGFGGTTFDNPTVADVKEIEKQYHLAMQEIISNLVRTEQKMIPINK